MTIKEIIVKETITVEEYKNALLFIGDEVKAKRMNMHEGLDIMNDLRSKIKA